MPVTAILALLANLFYVGAWTAGAYAVIVLLRDHHMTGPRTLGLWTLRGMAAVGAACALIGYGTS